MPLQNAFVVVSSLFIVSCSSTPRVSGDDADWFGKYARSDGKYDLHLKSEPPEDDKIISAYWTPPGGSPDGKEARMTLFRNRGSLAFSTHVRHALEDDCPTEMVYGDDGIQVIDRCRGNEDFSGIYRLVPERR